MLPARVLLTNWVHSREQISGIFALLFDACPEGKQPVYYILIHDPYLSMITSAHLLTFIAYINFIDIKKKISHVSSFKSFYK